MSILSVTHSETIVPSSKTKDVAFYPLHTHRCGMDVQTKTMKNFFSMFTVSCAKSSVSFAFENSIFNVNLSAWAHKNKSLANFGAFFLSWGLISESFAFPVVSTKIWRFSETKEPPQKMGRRGEKSNSFECKARLTKVSAEHQRKPELPVCLTTGQWQPPVREDWTESLTLLQLTRIRKLLWF